MKSHIDENNPQSIAEMKDGICCDIYEVEPQLCQIVIVIFNQRVGL